MNKEALDKLQQAVNEYSKLEATPENENKRNELLYEIASLPNEELQKAVQKYRVNKQNGAE